MRIILLSAILLLSGCSSRLQPEPAEPVGDLTSQDNSQSGKQIQSATNQAAGWPDEAKDQDALRVKVVYATNVGDYYKTAKLYFDGVLIRTFQGNADDGYYIKDAELTTSDDGTFILLNQVATSEVSDGSLVTNHEVPYCSIIHAPSGCMVAKETGEFCAGKFDAHFWISHPRGRLNLEMAIPKPADAKKADPADQRYFQDNLKACNFR